MSSIQPSMIANSLPLPQSAGMSHAAKGNPRSPEAAANVAKEFESLFATSMLKEMRQTLEPGSLFGEDSGDVYGGLFDRFMGEQMTKGQGLGLARMVQGSIERLQHSGGPKPAPSPSAAPDAAPTVTPPNSATTSVTG